MEVSGKGCYRSRESTLTSGMRCIFFFSVQVDLLPNWVQESGLAVCSNLCKPSGDWGQRTECGLGMG